ncbi:MAG: transporter substrate-binding domain-containing protein [bacterium]|nr:transporter substrate-binding domain-containing protein [bacterium]
MKKIHIVLLLGLMIVNLTACGTKEKEDKNKEDSAAVSKLKKVDKNKFIFATQDFPPFSYEINEQVSGPGAELITEICKEMNVDCSLRLLPWSRAQREVKNGSANALFFLARNEERDKWLYYSPPIINTSYGFFVSADNPIKYRKPSDIKGYTVGVYGPSNTSRSLGKISEKSSGVKIDMTPHDEAAFKKLSHKRIDAVYSNKEVGLAMIKKLGLKNIRYAGSSKSIKYYIAFSKEHTNKKNIETFISVYKKLYKRGTIGQILKKYHMQAAAF